MKESRARTWTVKSAIRGWLIRMAHEIGRHDELCKMFKFGTTHRICTITGRDVA